MVAAVLTSNGAGYIVDKLDNTVSTATYFIGWGTGGSSTGGTATYGDTGLKATATETLSTVGYATCTTSQPSADTLRFVSTITAGSAKTVEEVAVFTASLGVSAVGIIRGSHAGVGLATGDSIQYTVNLQIIPT